MVELSELGAGVAWVARAVEATSRVTSSIYSRIDPTTLSIVPSTLLLGALPIIWCFHKSTQEVIRPSILLQFKIAFVSLLIGTEAGLLSSCIISTNESTHGQVPAALLSLLAACSLGKVLVAEHGQTMSSSALLSLWLAIAAICDSLRADIFYNRQSSSSLSTAAIVLPVASSTMFKICLFVLSEFPKHHLIKDVHTRNRIAQKQTLGFFGRLVFLPIYETILTNFDKNLTMADLPDLDEAFAADRLLKSFNKEWNTMDRHPRYALAKLCGTVLAPNLVSSGLLRLLCSFFRVLQPMLIRSIVQYALGIYMLDTEAYTAVGLTLASVAVYGGLGFSEAFFTGSMIRIATLLRGTLIAAVYQKTLYLVSSDSKQHTAMDTINTKIEVLCKELAAIHSTWADPLELAVCMYMLFASVGNASFLVIVPIIASYIAGWYCNSRGIIHRITWHKQTAVRVARICDILSEVKAIKSIGLDTVFQNQAKKMFTNEINHLKHFRKWSVALLGFMQFFSAITYPLVLGGAMSLAVWAERISAVAAFTALPAIAILSKPLENCLSIWWRLELIDTRLSQIHEYLLTEELHNQPTQQTITYSVGETSSSTSAFATTFATNTPGQTQDETDHNVVFKLCNAAISTRKIPYPALEQVTITLKKGEVAMVVGRTQSGKSSLLRSLTGETQVTAGYHYKIPDSTAYCGQSVWLQNRSIRQNIIAYSAMDVEWYNEVLDICLLHPDIQQLPQADETIIKANGTELSDSQRHRVSLARALYSRSSILVLDDVFSCLDNDMILKIGSRLFGPTGLLQRSVTTVVLATHSRKLLRFATRIWLFDVDGRLIEQPGRFDDGFQRMLRTVLADIASDERQGLSANNYARETTLNAHCLRNADTEDIVLQNQRADAKRRGNWQALLFYLQTFQSSKLFLWFALAALMSLGEILPIAYIYPWLDTQLEGIIWLNGYVLLAIIGTSFLVWALYVWEIQLVPMSAEHLHDLLLETILDATFAYLSSVDLRSIITLVMQDMFSATAILSNDVLLVVYYTGNVCILSAIILYFSGMNSIFVPPAMIAILCTIQFCWMYRSRQLTYLELESRDQFRIHVTDTENGLEHIRAFGWQTQNLKSALQHIDISQKPFYYGQSTRNWLYIVLNAINAYIGTLLTIRTMLHLQTLSASGAGISMMALISLNSDLPSLISSYTSLQSSLGAAERIRGFIETTPREFGHYTVRPHVVSRQWPENGKLVMSNVSAKYDNSNRSPYVIQNISLTIPAKGRLGIVGETGSGKTSFALSILNLLEHTGDILIDGVNIIDVPHHLLRSRITTVSQDNIDFDESVRFNLCPWTMSDTESKVHDDSIIQMMKSLELWHLLVKIDGLDTRFRDLRLSIDEKRLMCIARACLRKLHFRSRLVIIDGSTKGLDDEAEELALRAMEVAFWDCTIIEMADHAEDLPDSDVILYLEKGKIVKKEFRRTGAPVPMDGPSVLPTMPAST